MMTSIFAREHTLLILLALFVLSCNEAEKEQQAEIKSNSTPRFDVSKFPQSIQRNCFFTRDGVSYLWGGKKPEQHFVVDNLVLKPEQFYFGLGREYFPALIEPRFVSAKEASRWLGGQQEIIGLTTKTGAKAFPLFLLERHEVVNDVTDGNPVVIIYCNLANLAAVYDRAIKGRVHTFGQSGYIYKDPGVWQGRHGFVLWDRETESLWWPLIEKAVSGPMLNTKMQIYDKSKWQRSTWREWKQMYPASLVLEKDQDFERPESWPQFDISDAN